MQVVTVLTSPGKPVPRCCLLGVLEPPSDTVRTGGGREGRRGGEEREGGERGEREERDVREVRERCERER